MFSYIARSLVVISFLNFALLAIAADPSRTMRWPFDQRQILLAKPEGQSFPDDLTVAQIMDLFVKRGRVRWVTAQGGRNQLVPVEIPSDFQWRSADAVRNLGTKYRVDGALLLSQQKSEVQLHWYSAADGQPLFFETLFLPEPGKTVEMAEKRKQRLNEWLSDIWSRIPGQGYLVRRDSTSVEIEGADKEGFRIGDQVEFVRLEEIKRHPVLKTLAEIKSSIAGVGEILTLNSPFSKVKIIYESNLDPLREGDRYRLIRRETSAGSMAQLPGGQSAGSPISRPPETTADSAKSTSSTLGGMLGIQSQFLDLSLRGGYGKLSHSEVTAASDTLEMSSSGYLLKAHAELLISRDWFGSFDYAFGLHKFSTVPTEYGESSISSGMRNLMISAGYRWTIDEAAESSGALPTQLLFYAGYHRLLGKMAPTSSDVAPSQKTYSGLFAAVGLRIPMMDMLGLSLDVTRAFGTSLGEAVESSGATSQNVLWSYDFSLAYAMSRTQNITLGFHGMSASTTFSGDGTRTTSAALADLRAVYGSLGYQMKF